MIDDSTKSEPALTVAICTRNRCQSLLRALAGLTERAVTDWELLIVDNGSRDETRSACESLADDFPAPLRVVEEPVAGLSHARNRALAEARGRVVVFLDDDVTCHPGLVDAHAAAFSDSAVVASGGRILPVLPQELSGRWRSYLERTQGGPTGRYDFGPRASEIPGPTHIFLPFGGNLGVRRDLALAEGGFRVDLGFGGQLVPGEETALLTRLAERGRIVYVPGATVDHHVGTERAGLAYFRRWHRGYGRSLVRMQPKRSWMGTLGAIFLLAARSLRFAIRRADAYSMLQATECGLGQILEVFARRRSAP